MKVLFAIKEDNGVVASIERKFKQDDKTKFTYNKVDSLNAIIKELQKSNYNRVVVSEDFDDKLKYTKNTKDQAKKYLKKIVSSAGKAKVIFCANDKSNLKDLVDIDVYNIVVGKDKMKKGIYDLLNNPNNKEKAMEMYGLNKAESAKKEVKVVKEIPKAKIQKAANKTSSTKSSSSVNDLFTNIKYLNREDLEDDKYVKRFDTISSKFDKTSMEIIVKSLSPATKKILRKKSSAYNELLGLAPISKKSKEETTDSEAKRRGRPRKEKVEQEDENKVVKRRGRPRKEEDAPKAKSEENKKEEKKIEKKKNVNIVAAAPVIKNAPKKEKEQPKVEDDDDILDLDDFIIEEEPVKKEPQEKKAKKVEEPEEFDLDGEVFDLENEDVDLDDEVFDIEDVEKKDSDDEDFEDDFDFDDDDEKVEEEENDEDFDLEDEDEDFDLEDDEEDEEEDTESDEEDEDFDLEDEDEDFDLEDDEEDEEEDTEADEEDEDFDLEDEDDIDDDEILNFEDDEEDTESDEEDEDFDLEDEDDIDDDEILNFEDDEEDEEEDTESDEDDEDLDLEDEDDIDDDEILNFEDDEENEEEDTESDEDDEILNFDDDEEVEEEDEEAAESDEDDDILNFDDEDDEDNILNFDEEEESKDSEETEEDSDDDILNFDDEDEDEDILNFDDEEEESEENVDTKASEDDDDDILNFDDDDSDENSILNFDEDEESEDTASESEANKAEESNDDSEDDIISLNDDKNDDDDLISLDDDSEEDDILNLDEDDNKDETADESGEDTLKINENDNVSTGLGFGGIQNINYNSDNNISKQINEINEEDEFVDDANNNQIASAALNIAQGQKIVAFVGGHGNGTSFIVNNMASLLADQGISVAILDVTKNKNSYYIYTENQENLRGIAYSCFEKLSSGIADGIKVNKNLTVYTSLPNSNDTIENKENAMNTILSNSQLVLIDCDVDTEEKYFEIAQEIYLVQSLDILTIQPLTSLLKKLKMNQKLDESKLRVLINKEIKVNELNDRILISAMSVYNSPDTTYQLDLFNRDTIQYLTIPFEERNYCKYLGELARCKLRVSGYSKSLINSFNKLAKMIYPIGRKRK